MLKFTELGQDYKCFTRVSRFLVKRWRFRDGYYNEQHDDEVCRNERTSLVGHLQGCCKVGSAAQDELQSLKWLSAVVSSAIR